VPLKAEPKIRNSSEENRWDILKTIHDFFKRDKPGNFSPKIYVLYGYPSMGKSWIAKKFAIHFDDYDCVYCLNARKNLLEEFKGLANRLFKVTDAVLNREDTDLVKVICSSLNQAYQRWLLVFEHLEDIGDIEKFLPINNNKVFNKVFDENNYDGLVRRDFLISTNDRSIRANSDYHLIAKEVSNFSDDDIVSYSYTLKDFFTEKDFTDLANDLRKNPAALSIAIDSILKEKISIDSWRAQYRQSSRMILDTVIGGDKKTDKIYHTYFPTIEIYLQKLQALNVPEDEAIISLYYFAFAGFSKVPKNLIGELISFEYRDQILKKLEQHVVKKYSLISKGIDRKNVTELLFVDKLMSDACWTFLSLKSESHCSLLKKTYNKLMKVLTNLVDRQVFNGYDIHYVLKYFYYTHLRVSKINVEFNLQLYLTVGKHLMAEGNAQYKNYLYAWDLFKFAINKLGEDEFKTKLGSDIKISLYLKKSELELIFLKGNFDHYKKNEHLKDEIKNNLKQIIAIEKGSQITVNSIQAHRLIGDLSLRGQPAALFVAERNLLKGLAKLKKIESLQIGDELVSECVSLKISLYILLSKLAKFQKSYDYAKLLLKNIINDFYKDLESWRQQLEIYQELGKCYDLDGNYKVAENYYLKALNIVETYYNSISHGSALFNNEISDCKFEMVVLNYVLAKTYKKNAKNQNYQTCIAKVRMILEDNDLLYQQRSSISGKTILHLAASAGDTEMFKNVLRKFPLLINYKDKRDRTAFDCAAMNGEVDILRNFSIKRTQYDTRMLACLNLDERDRRSSAEWAAEYGQFEALKYLLGSDFNWSSLANIYTYFRRGYYFLQRNDVDHLNNAVKDFDMALQYIIVLGKEKRDIEFPYVETIFQNLACCEWYLGKDNIEAARNCFQKAEKAEEMKIQHNKKSSVCFYVDYAYFEFQQGNCDRGLSLITKVRTKDTSGITLSIRKDQPLDTFLKEAFNNNTVSCFACSDTTVMLNYVEWLCRYELMKSDKNQANESRRYKDFISAYIKFEKLVRLMPDWHVLSDLKHIVFREVEKISQLKLGKIMAGSFSNHLFFKKNSHSLNVEHTQSPPNLLMNR